MTPHPIALAAAAAVVGLFAGLALGPNRPLAQATYGYGLANSGNNTVVWRIDVSNGRVAQCIAGDAKNKPRCSPWSD